MDSVYARLGIPTIINAKGPSTRVSGAPMPPAVIAAMADGARHFVDMAVLQARASEIIAEATGAEAGYVTSGAAAGLVLGTAACVTGADPGRMNRLPDTVGMPNEVVVVRSQRNLYDHAVRAVGVKLVEVGLADRFAGAGIRDAEPWEIADSIGERTAAVLYVASPNALPPLPEVARVAHAKGVPVLVDAAGQLPPASNLRRFIAEGADLVVFSGGKAIRGPQGTGILAGRRDLIAAAALQNMDMDITLDLWSAPESLVPREGLPGLPQHGIGRPCKVGKEEVVALLVALQLFVEADFEREERRLRRIARDLLRRMRGIPSIRLEFVDHAYKQGIPGVRLILDEPAAGMTARDLARELQGGTPSIHADYAGIRDGAILFCAMCLKPGDTIAIARRVAEVLV